MFTISVTYTKRSQITFQNYPICHNHIKQCPSLRSFISLKCDISKIIQKTSSTPYSPSMSNILKRFATATVGLHLTILSFFIKRSPTKDFWWSLVSEFQKYSNLWGRSFILITLGKPSWWAGPVGHGWWTQKENRPWKDSNDNH